MLRMVLHQLPHSADGGDAGYTPDIDRHHLISKSASFCGIRLLMRDAGTLTQDIDRANAGEGVSTSLWTAIAGND